MDNPTPNLRGATLGHVVPYVAFVGLMALEQGLSWPAAWFYPLRLAVTLAAVLLLSRPYLSPKLARPLASCALGVAVFAIWIAPDLLFGYRHHFLFENPFTGSTRAVLPLELRGNVAFLAVRLFGAAVLVPIVEELFWRGWLMRWLIAHNFMKVPLGRYTHLSFWVTAVLFASEHGAYWEVGLAAGIAYNWWLVKTHNLADCILAHGVTNACLSIYVIVFAQWQYWP